MTAANLRSRLREGPLIGTFVKLPRPEVVELLGIAGVHFVVCDMEHGQVTEREAREAILAGRASGVDVMVRVASFDTGLFNRLLEAGAAGIQLPHLQSKRGTIDFVASVTYPPDGGRSMSTAQPSAGFGTEPLRNYIDRSLGATLRVGQFETVTYHDSLEDVTRDLDVAFIGTLDLSLEAGAPGDFGHVSVTSAIAAIEAAARGTGTMLGAHATTRDAAHRLIDRGYRYIVVGTDIGFLLDGARLALDGISPRPTA